MRCKYGFWGAVVALCTLAGCNKLLETTAMEEPPVEAGTLPDISVEQVARLFAGLPIGAGQMEEVHDAVCASAGNGYDEEYTLRDLLSTPGSGVGDAATRAPARSYERPLRDLLREALTATRAASAEDYLSQLTASDLQLYWPFSESWDGTQLPVVTFDPGDFAVENTGYALQPDGSVESVLVNEAMAQRRPVWVVNRNSDADYTALELLRRQDPSWGQGGGDILVRSASSADKDIKTLILRSVKAKRNFDSWFCGGSELLFKVGSVEDFWASTEAELRLYQPSITDFMIVVKRDQVGVEIPFDAVMVSELTDQLESIAFMIIEDDGGKRSTWKCSTKVTVKSKAFGIDLEIPLNTADDIVWRGQLTGRYLDKFSGTMGHFGDVDLLLEFI